MKEYIFLFNTEEKHMINFLQDFLQDDVIIKPYGNVGGVKTEGLSSIWVTKDKYKYAYAIFESPTLDGLDEDYQPLTLKDCEEWMRHFIKQKNVIKK